MIKPMLAAAADFSKLQYPLFASPKLDGIRCLVINGVAKTRALKDIPNKALSSLLSLPEFDGLDGELIVGDPTADDVYNKTVSVVMSHDKPATDVDFYVFDDFRLVHGFAARYSLLKTRLRELQLRGAAFIQMHPSVVVENEEHLLELEAETVAVGFEGLILRSMNSPYKYGRSTANEGYLLKVKRFEDSEAEILDFEEEMFNGNAAVTNELGRTKRSTAAAGLVGKGTLGAFRVRDRVSSVEFSIGTGLTAAQRADFWQRRSELKGQLVKYKFFPVGVKVAPRHPVFLGFRDRSDL